MLTTFKRLQALSSDPAVIAKAVADSDLVEVSKDSTKIRRVSALPEQDDSISRSIYAKNLPKDQELDCLAYPHLARRQ